MKMQWFIDIIMKMVAALGYTTLAEVLGYAPKARASPIGAQWVPKETWTALRMDGEQYDTHSLFANDRFTAAQDGYYQVNAGAMIDQPDPDTIFLTAIYKNGVAYTKARIHASWNSNIACVVSDLVPLSAGETIRLWCYHDNTTGKYITAHDEYTFLSITQVF